MGGLDLIRQLRSQAKTFPILILTARGNWQDKVEGLAAGADDYVVKPFQFEELEARMNALLRRSSGLPSRPSSPGRCCWTSIASRRPWTNSRWR
jgi:DNA-binding response OmpR family regulator